MKKTILETRVFRKWRQHTSAEMRELRRGIIAKARLDGMKRILIDKQRREVDLVVATLRQNLLDCTANQK